MTETATFQSDVGVAPPHRAGAPGSPTSIGSNTAQGGLSLSLLRVRSYQAQAATRLETFLDRRRKLTLLHRVLVERADELAQQAASVRGCTVGEALATEVMPLLDAARFLARRAHRILGPRRPGATDRPAWLTGVDCEIQRQPLGLILIISPGNYPLFLAGVQLIQALAAGNAVWVKPAPGGTNVLEPLRDAVVQAGYPCGIIQLLPESPDAAQAAIGTGVDKVIFTGSAATGRKILGSLAPQLTPAVMELSGSDAVFIRGDADLLVAAQAVRFGLSLNRGATCIAPRRIFVEGPLLGPFCRQLTRELQRSGPIRISNEAAARWLPLVREALQDGAFIIAGALHPDHVKAPLVLGGVAPRMRLMQDDTFAPLAGVVGVAGDDEAISASEQCPFALGASVFGKDIAAARRLAARIRAGSVVLNDLIAPTADPRLPFGGLGASGFGVTRGPEGLLEMTAPKVVITNRSRWRPHYRPFRESDTPLFQSLLQLGHGRSLFRRLGALARVVFHFRKPDSSPTTSSK